MKLLEYLKLTMTPEEYNRTVYRLSGYTDEEIKQLPQDADKWLGQSEGPGRPRA
jgi:hypothetical protein